ncbi:hypothetical protein LGP01_23295, partial [Escherichia coli]|nr:hypothetical protein [Escherichia coli]
MHITYDLPVAIDDIIEAKQRLAGRIYKTGMPRSNYFREGANKQVISSQADSLIKISRIWA